MARTLVTKNESAKRYPLIQPPADSLDFAFVTTSGGDDDGYEYVATGREVVLLRNTGEGANTFTLHSVVDEFGREGDIAAYSLAAGEFAVLIPPLKGFQQADGRIDIDVSDPEVNICVLQLPNIS